MSKYQICTRCIMDTTDPEIRFDERGVCNHCLNYENLIKPTILPDIIRNQKRDEIVNKIKEAGKGKDHDCIIGVSGGVDSTFLAYKAKELGLRPLAVHLDNGWNSELSVSNIEKTIKKLGIDLYTYVIDWEEFKDLQLSFLEASVPDLEIPTDHAIVAILHQMAIKEKVKYILLGVNSSTETVLPRYWSHGHNDWKYIKNIHQLFGRVPLKTFPHFSFIDQIKYHYLYRINVINILDYVEYVKRDALAILQQELNWQDYGGKHYESIYTRFIQAYILPTKFNIDKRKMHLSSMINSRQLTREEALKEMQEEIYPKDKLREDMQFVLNKFHMSMNEFNNIMSLPIKTFWDYPSYETSQYINILRTIKRGLIKK